MRIYYSPKEWALNIFLKKESHAEAQRTQREVKVENGKWRMSVLHRTQCPLIFHFQLSIIPFSLSIFSAFSAPLRETKKEATENSVAS